MSKILVIGSSNTDLIVQVKNLPLAGETIIGRSFKQVQGGKGANQALAAHKLGGEVKFITCLGRDSNSRSTLKYFQDEGLDVSSSSIVDGVPMGTAMIMVNEDGENTIVVVPGANEALSIDYIRQVEHEIANSDYVLLQMEVSYATVKEVCLLAAQHQTRVIMNVAPATEIEGELYKSVDILIVNETEIETLTEKKISENGEELLIDTLLSKGVNNVILTLGKKGSLVKSKGENVVMEFIPAYRVKAQDTTAAGDTFCGALVARLSKGESLKEAAGYAAAAAAICVTRLGAQPSIPTAQEVNDLLTEQEIDQTDESALKYKKVI